MLHDPPRILAWRLLHDPRLAAAPAWLAPLLPRPAGGLDRDPVALLLGALLGGLAVAYLLLATFGARPLFRGVVIGLAALVLVIGPTAAFVAMGVALDRPYGQDGGVVQLPLALDLILAGQSPYGADYSDSILGRQARVSTFWETYGGNPILRHHAYLPGTHLLMMPFHLGSRALFGFFDPRLVTLLAYLLAIALAVRLVDGPPRRLAAAALVALNPLVYWQQIFGANDVLFVALLLGAVLLAGDGRATASGLLLGLACATKQLAWPFAPFLLLYLSGARTFRELLGAEARRRLARPLLAAAGVFVVVVAPLAALDPRAFWGDIVAYNVGLPGGENYPLGGTPGFGVANFLIYFGRVGSLRDYFPFGVFYVLLIPVVVLLMRRQLREGEAAAALFNGSAALLAVLYFSRVVHPNYLIPVALLLPLAVLALRLPADFAVVPLLLLAAAVGIAEHAVFRATWDQAVAGGVAKHLSPLLALLTPRTGPTLTSDPLGLLLSATAAGLALLYLTAAALGAPLRLRTALVLLAAVTVVVVPTMAVTTIGERTGVPRGQEEWIVQVPADAARLARGESPYAPPVPEAPRGREAWATSFRLDPPRELLPRQPLMPPGAALMGAVTRPLGLRDPRGLSLFALAAMALVLLVLLGGDAKPLGLAVATLTLPVAFGTVFGSGASLALVAIALAFAAGARGQPLAAGILAGLAAGIDHRALLVVPFALRTVAAARPARVLAGTLLGYGLLVALPALLDPSRFVSRLASLSPLGPGLGLANLFFYRGLEDTVAVQAVFALAPALAALAALLLLRWGRSCPLLLGATAALIGLWLSRASPVEAMAVPIVLMALAAIGEPETAARA